MAQVEFERAQARRVEIVLRAAQRQQRRRHAVPFHALDARVDLQRLALARLDFGGAGRRRAATKQAVEAARVVKRVGVLEIEQIEQRAIGVDRHILAADQHADRQPLQHRAQIAGAEIVGRGRCGGGQQVETGGRGARGETSGVASSTGSGVIDAGSAGRRRPGRRLRRRRSPKRARDFIESLLLNRRQRRGDGPRDTQRRNFRRIRRVGLDRRDKRRPRRFGPKGF